MEITDKTGTPAEPFNLPGLDDHRYIDTDFTGRWLLLVFLRHLG